MRLCPLSEWRAAFAAVAEEIATADNAVRAAQIKQRDIDHPTLRGSRPSAVPRRRRSSEVRIDLNAASAAPVLLRRHLRGARRALDAGV